jgi:hypothetical protein
MPIAFEDLEDDLHLELLTREPDEYLLLRHESVPTTQEYLHPSRDDLAHALTRLQVVNPDSQS